MNDLGFTPPLPRIAGLEAIFAAIYFEADYRITRDNEGEHWTRERQLTWLRFAWAYTNGEVRS